MLGEMPLTPGAQIVVNGHGGRRGRPQQNIREMGADEPRAPNDQEPPKPHTLSWTSKGKTLCKMNMNQS
jgi:hypothetical protein